MCLFGKIAESCSNAQIILFTIRQLLFKITAAWPFKAFDLNVKTIFNTIELSFFDNVSLFLSQ